MEVRIIKTTAGYIPQVYKKEYGREQWWSLTNGAGDYVHEWSEPEAALEHATHWTKWGAMKTLKKWLYLNIDGTKRLEAFKKELDQPNVVYEAEV